MTNELHQFFAADAEAGSTWARDATAAGVSYVHMPNAEDEIFREATKAGRYVCPLDECGADLRVAAGPINRHHWRHRVAPVPAHAPESLWHQAAKAAIATWSAATCPSAEIIVDSRRTPAGSKPDVWVRAGALDVAFEVQLSALEAGDLRTRSERCHRDRIVPVWLFGHRSRPRLPDAEDTDSPRAARLTQEHREAVTVGPLRWLNPDRREVATAYVEETARPDARFGQRWPGEEVPTITYVRRPTQYEQQVFLRIDPLDDCTLDETGMHAPADVWIDERIAEARRLEDQAVEAENLRRASRTTPLGSSFQKTTPPAPAAAPTSTQPPRSAFAKAGGPSRPQVAVRKRSSHPSESRPCAFCGGAPVRRSEWPSWYRPPTDTTAVVMCATCDTTLGSVRGTAS